MSNLASYWPLAPQVLECLSTEAETVDEALLLAVHEPVSLLRRAAQTGIETIANEADLLNELMRPVDDGSAVLVTITGASGIGKSHMVRWLGAQLQRHPARDRLVIVSIPKTASLRQVVELILEPLGGEAFETLKRELSSITDALDPPRAAELLAATIGSELHVYAERAVSEINADRSRHSQLGPRITIAKKVRNLIRDPMARDNWFADVLIRIVGSSLGGASDPDQRRFSAKDLTPPESLRLGDYSGDTLDALNFLGRNDGRDRVVAAEILQEVLDPALRTLFGFAETFRQKTIQEVVDDIRRQLLHDGKELVLLVEDLATLAGVQQPLLDIVITESVHQGKWVRAPIRTALAVTDGFMPGRQTLLTRARGEWVIPSEGLSEEVVVQRLVEMTGRYLNAARWGLEELKNSFEARASEQADLYAWVPSFEPVVDAQSAELLKAFGTSSSGYALFPFNELAVRSLGENALKRADRWVFNPRAFIIEVLRKTLFMRDGFEQGVFPPSNFVQPKLQPGVRQELQFQYYSQTESERLESLIYHWAGAPSSLRQWPQAPKAVFDAFKLPWPFERNFKEPPTVPPVSASSGKNTTVTVLVQPEAEPAVGDVRFEGALEAWSSDMQLTGDDPKRVRQLLTAALKERITPDTLRLQGQGIDFKWFWLPPERTVGNRSAGFIIRVAEPGEPIPLLLVQGLRALSRWDTNGKSWSYADAEIDYPMAQALLDQLETQVVQLLESEAQRDLRMLCTVLHRQNLILGLSRKAEPEAPRIQELMIRAPVEPMPREDDSLPSAVRKVFSVRAEALTGREDLQTFFANRLGCYQGVRGITLLAVDTERLKTAWKRVIEGRWMLFLDGAMPIGTASTDALERMSDTGVEQLVRYLQTTVEAFQPMVADAFDKGHARVVWREDLLSTLQLAKRLSLWPTKFDETQLKKIVTYLADEKSETIISGACNFKTPDPQRSLEVQLAAWSSLPMLGLIKVAHNVQMLGAFFSALEKLCADQAEAMGQEAALREREGLLNSLTWDLQ